MSHEIDGFTVDTVIVEELGEGKVHHSSEPIELYPEVPT